MCLYDVIFIFKKKFFFGFQNNQNSFRVNFKKIRKKIYYNNCEDLEKNFDKIKYFDKIEIRIIIIINIF